jgi:hypothetical protein
VATASKRGCTIVDAAKIRGAVAPGAQGTGQNHAYDRVLRLLVRLEVPAARARG